MATQLDPGPLARAVADAEDAALRERPRRPVAERLTRIHAAREQRRGRDTSLRGPIAAGLALGSVVAAALVWPRGEPLEAGTPPLAFAVGEAAAPGRVGEWVAAATMAAPIAFSDGTRILVDPGARARVVAVNALGAQVVVERGAVRADVVPRAGNDWSVIGGPFEIHVTGTRFDARWDPEREELSVTMHHGRVVVRAPCLAAPRVLGDDEAATLSCAPPTTAASDEAHPAPTVASEPGATAAPVAAAAPPSTASAAASSTAMAARPSWREIAGAGQYKEALAAAEAEGFGRLCEELSAAELMELGATARLGGRTARAAEAYAAVRRRFPGGDAAATAAFHLGQLTFDGAHAYAEGHRWFLTYLSERPGGALAAEALGRAMEAEQRLGDLAAARATATRYLARYPTGAHAALASSLLSP